MGHDDWIAPVRKGMEDMYEKHVKALEREGWVDEPELENRERRKPASVLKQRAVYEALGIITSDKETEDTFSAGLAVKTKAAATNYSHHSHLTQAGKDRD